MMLIVSWNVAGLKPALQRIHGDYGGSANNANNANNKSKNNNNPNPLGRYLALHNNISILCLQEHKIPHSSLSSRSEPHRCSSVNGYESYWSCATSKNSRGFNGTVTYARNGKVMSADSRPLNDDSLDDQGRCVMTDHGTFVLFNVYVPHSRDGDSLSNKMRFLNALRVAMDRQRLEFGRRVMLLGDLNLKIDRRDVYWKFLRVNVDDLLEGMKDGGDGGIGDGDGDGDDEEGLPTWKEDVANHWEEIVRVLGTIEAMPRQTQNPTTKKTFDKFVARVRVKEDKYVVLGNAEDTAEDALGCYDLGERYYVDPSNDTSTLYRRKNCLCIETLAELMSKICNVNWNVNTQRQISRSREAGLNPDSPAYLWMKGLLEGDGMVDVFRHFYPTAEGRFTCWHQQRNMRYENVGGRIDYTLVDKELMDHVEPNNDETLLRCGKDAAHDNPLGEEAAFLAATGGGLFVPGTFAGGGIAEATKRALDTQFGRPHSGVIYTPPSYSDHVAVSLLMKGDFGERAGELTLAGDASTRRAQPHKRQRSVASFFSAAGSEQSYKGGGRSLSSLSGDKRAASGDDNTSSKKKSLDSYFGGSKKTTKENGPSRNLNSAKSACNKKKQSIPKNSVLKHFGKK